MKFNQRRAIKSMNMTLASKALFEILWYSQLPCFQSQLTVVNEKQSSLLKKCIWKGRAIPCAAIFKLVSSEMLMLYSSLGNL